MFHWLLGLHNKGCFAKPRRAMFSWGRDYVAALSTAGHHPAIVASALRSAVFPVVNRVVSMCTNIVREECWSSHWASKSFSSVYSLIS